MPTFRPRLGPVPSSITGPLRGYLEQVQSVVNAFPQMSLFSGVSPNSAVTGQPGDLALNVGSASTDSRLWMMGGTGDQLRSTGWVTVRTLA